MTLPIAYPGTGGNLTLTSSTVPTNGAYLPSANTVGIATNGTLRVSVSTTAASIGLNTIVGSTSVAPDGTLHVHTATAGTVAASADASTGVFEFGAAAGGVSILGPDASDLNIYFGSPTSNVSGLIRNNYSGNYLKILTNKVGSELILGAGAGVTNLTLSGASGSELATFAGDVTLSEGKLTITNTANERAVEVTSSSTGNYAFLVTANSLVAGGSALTAYSNSANTGAFNVLEAINGNSAATGAYALKLQQGAANAFINYVGTAAANTTDPISTLTTSGATTHHIQIDINGTKAWIACSTNNPS